MDCDIVIIGAGVVGLAIAAEVSKPNREIFLVEQHKSFGQETSSRNSEVVHAGIYYPKDSLKAKFCVEGAKRLYEICSNHAIPFQRIGKLIVATSNEEIESLKALKAKGEANETQNLRMIEKNEVKHLEPNIRARAALFSPNTGIVDSHHLMKHFESKALANDVSVVYGCRVLGIKSFPGGYCLSIDDAEGTNEITTRVVINSAGLHAHKIAQMIGIDIERHGYAIHYCKGEYFGVNPAKSKLVNRLIYPSPMEELTGLGIHSTRDLGGRLKLGPNAYYVDQIDYEINNSHGSEFFESARQFLPFLEKDDLFPDMAGVRPKLQGPGENVRDFVIQHEAENGFPGFINLLGIESPGLTASPAIAAYVGGLVDEVL